MKPRLDRDSIKEDVGKILNTRLPEIASGQEVQEFRRGLGLLVVLVKDVLDLSPSIRHLP